MSHKSVIQIFDRLHNTPFRQLVGLTYTIRKNEKQEKKAKKCSDSYWK